MPTKLQLKKFVFLFSTASLYLIANSHTEDFVSFVGLSSLFLISYFMSDVKE